MTAEMCATLAPMNLEKNLRPAAPRRTIMSVSEDVADVIFDFAFRMRIGRDEALRLLASYLPALEEELVIGAPQGGAHMEAPNRDLETVTQMGEMLSMDAKSVYEFLAEYKVPIVLMGSTWGSSRSEFSRRFNAANLL
ncbi:hypothetical protein J2W20_002392 [Sinomonas atrocyanea]|uniref:hypothetical protein n=1 Tax=Sinomonas atrocyanea TaxID=37927 RepID=UPI002787537D|nr:hypothetical protein [Sinomonas atrocyanea]MDQ0260488.1 hypothetical protein [Sinomonas atrocyanea]